MKRVVVAFVATALFPSWREASRQRATAMRVSSGSCSTKGRVGWLLHFVQRLHYTNLLSRSLSLLHHATHDMHTPSRALSPAVPHALSNLLSLFIFHATQNVGGCYYEVERPTTPIYHVHTPSRTLSPSLSFEPRHTLQNVGGCYYEVERPTTPICHVHTPSRTLSLSPTCSLSPALSPALSHATTCSRLPSRTLSPTCSLCPALSPALSHATTCSRLHLLRHYTLSLPFTFYATTRSLSDLPSLLLSLSTLSVVEESFSFFPPWKKNHGASLPGGMVDGDGLRVSEHGPGQGHRTPVRISTALCTSTRSCSYFYKIECISGALVTDKKRTT